MTMAAAIDSRTADTPARTRSSRIAHIEIFDSLGAAESVWRGLEAGQQLSTPYQRFDLLSIWQSEVGRRDNTSPFIVIAYDSERRPLVLMPLALAHRLGARTASFMGGKHTTFNMALWNKEFAANVTAADLDCLLLKIRKHAAVDMLALTRQPVQWRGLPNPFAQLPHQPSVNGCPAMTMPPSAEPAALISNSFRKRLKSKERKLQALPGFRCYIATADADIGRLLDWFFRIKPQRMAQQGLPNVFAEPGVEAFIRTACLTPLPGGDRIIDIHVLECNEEVIALFAGVADGYRFSMMFNTYTLSEHSRQSPGLILIRNIVDYYTQRGYSSLDLGIGSDDYKRLFCKDNEQTIDSFIALSGRGRLAASAMATIGRSKRLVKRNPALLKAAQRLRNAFQ